MTYLYTNIISTLMLIGLFGPCNIARMDV